jgi:hypothetical protein
MAFHPPKGIPPSENGGDVVVRVLDSHELTVEGSHSILGFDTEGGGDWKVWDRYLTFHGRRIYHIGNICGTCSFFFKEAQGITRGRSDNVTAEDLVRSMTAGLKSIDSSFLDPISLIMPDGEYVVALIQTTPRLVTPGSEADYFAHEQVEAWGLDEWELPKNPDIKYYRGIDQALGDDARLFEFIVPIFPVRWLQEEKVEEFRSIIRGGAVPTALALSVLDIKQAWDSAAAHWCFAHYLVDGHHKVMAANQEVKPLTILSFIAVKESISSKDDVARLLGSI